MFPSVIEQVIAQRENDDVPVDEDTIIFMDNTTSWQGRSDWVCVWGCTHHQPTQHAGTIQVSSRKVLV